MDTSGLQRVKAIFAEAIEKPENERVAFIAQACGDDAALRGEVEAFLSAAQRAGEFLAAPTRDESVAAPNSSGESIGTKIGRYKLLELIGEGGFGNVFMAEQEHPIRRKVALKIIKAGMDTKQVIARFEAERQALAMMDHPNIAKVLDAGATESGRPYFVMELVHGIPITEYCDRESLNIQ
ncbi:MAG TPA: protein kinase, partial [Tepidisphaeraceae bacterium]|nr:protein kinase [Tepidisphaeraceae bacterium]